MNFDLPATSTAQPPQFTNLDQCRDWQRALPLSNPVQTQAMLLQQMLLLNRYALPGAMRLAMLETLREPIQFVQEESAKKFSGKPLPLAPAEQTALDTAHGLWQAQSTGYLHCLADCLAGDGDLAAQAALLCQRVLAALCDEHADLVRAGSHPDARLWRKVHQTFAAAEQLGVSTVAVTDALRSGGTQTPMAAYAELMLLSVAGLHELTPRQQSWVMRWVRRWCGKVAVLTAPPLESKALPLCVDLDGDQPAGHKPLHVPAARWLDTSELRKSIKGRLARLAQGGPEDTPAKLGLGEDCPAPTAIELLRRLYPRWIKGGIVRRAERWPQTGPCRLVAGVEMIHYYVSGHRPFKPPGHISADELRRQREELATFGRIANRFEEDYSRDHGYQIENWEVVEDWGTVDRSNGGLRVARSLRQVGGRLGIGQLVAVQPPGASVLLLGVTRWVQIVGDSLVAGIQLFPGEPRAVAVRGTGPLAAKELYRQGFMLPHLIDQPATLILPPGSTKPGRVMEAWSPEGTRNFRLKEVLVRGADFERVVCEEI